MQENVCRIGILKNQINKEIKSALKWKNLLCLEDNMIKHS